MGKKSCAGLSLFQPAVSGKFTAITVYGHSYKFDELAGPFFKAGREDEMTS